MLLWVWVSQRAAYARDKDQSGSAAGGRRASLVIEAIAVHGSVEAQAGIRAPGSANLDRAQGGSAGRIGIVRGACPLQEPAEGGGPIFVIRAGDHADRDRYRRSIGPTYAPAPAIGARTETE